MHSFNYDEQANQLQQQQQQQQILLDQDYASGSVTADYNLDPESSVDARKQNGNIRVKEEFTYLVDGVEQPENNIEYEGVRSPMPYSKKMSNIGDTITTKFYTTLPNREAAEKLAALAAAGNVNSHLIGQLQKQQQQQQQENIQNDESMPPNHKNDDNVNQQSRTSDQLQKYNPHKYHKNQQQNHKPNYKVQNDEKLPLQIMVPEEDEYITEDQMGDIRKDNVDVEYEYEDEDGEIEESQESTASFDRQITPHNNDPHAEFGSRLRSKTRE